MADDLLPLEAEIRRRIEAAGPMPVGQFMALCLTHPQYGYYLTRDPFGAAGDFTTAPEVTQMFGELIGLWAASVWRQMDAPENVRLVELGPGRGTMMLDVLRAAKAVPAFRAAIVVHFVEISPALDERQRQAVSGSGVHVEWHRSLDEVPDGPTIVLANEFFDPGVLSGSCPTAGAAPAESSPPSSGISSARCISFNELLSGSKDGRYVYVVGTVRDVALSLPYNPLTANGQPEQAYPLVSLSSSSLLTMNMPTFSTRSARTASFLA